LFFFQRTWQGPIVKFVGDFNGSLLRRHDSANLTLIASFSGLLPLGRHLWRWQWTDPQGKTYVVPGLEMLRQTPRGLRGSG